MLNKGLFWWCIKNKLVCVAIYNIVFSIYITQSWILFYNIYYFVQVESGAKIIFLGQIIGQGGTVASWLVRSSPDRVVRVRALAGDIVLCSWARHLTLTVPLFTQVYKWVPANLMLGVTLRWTSIPSRGSRNTPSRFMLQKPGEAPAWLGHLARTQTLPYLLLKHISG